MSNIDHIVELAFQYGPFLFALLFLLSITRWAQAKHHDLSHEQPAASPEDIRTYRLVYLASFVFGLLLVVTSIVWWWRYRPSTFLYRGVIDNLDETQALQADVAYFQAYPVPSTMTDVPEQRDERFVIIQSNPFTTDAKFEFRFAKKGGSGKVPHRLYVPYSSDHEPPHFVITFDSQTGDYEIQQTKPPSAHATQFRLVQPLLASPIEGLPQVTRGARAIARAAPPGVQTLSVVATLQDEHSLVGAKIEALEQLNGLNDSSFRAVMGTVTKKEPMAVTLLDLSRHSDPELAYKAGKALGRFDLMSFIEAKQKSTNLGDRTVAAQIVQRKNTALRPTASSQGDRYYLQLKWDPKDKKVVTCLTSTLNNGTGATRSLEEEAKLMAGLNQRVVYGGEKSWTLWMADEVRKCGAMASYIGVRPQSKK